MNLRYYANETAILECKPSYRSIFVNGGEIIRVPFPWLYFVFQWDVVPGGYLYKGLRGPGLRVLLRKEIFDSFENRFISSPTEHYSYGASCLSHNLDSTIFGDPRTLMGTILNVWWSSPHFIDNEDWTMMSLEEVFSYPWKEFMLFNNFLLPVGSIINEPVGVLPIDKFKLSLNT